MYRQNPLSLAGLLLLALLLPHGAAHASDILPPPERIGPHSYAWIGPYGPPTRDNRGFRMNLGFVVGEQAVAVIDSGYGPAMAEAMLQHIRRITDRPVRYVINTNSQPHRIMGNPVFRRQGARILAAETAVARMRDSGQQFAAAVARVLEQDPADIPVPRTPDELLSEPRTIDLGGQVRVTVRPVGHAHTAGSSIVEARPDGVVFAGDVLYRGRLLALLPVSRLEGWIASYDLLRDYPQATLFVPGHGEPGPLAAFEQPTYAYLTTLRDHMAAAAREWIGLDEAIDSLDQSDWRKLADFEALAGRNAHQAYLEFEGSDF